MAAPLYPWWQKAVFYQAYLPGFVSVKARETIPGALGAGDRKSLDERLDYLLDLGIDALEINPLSAFFPNENNIRENDHQHMIAPEFQEVVECAHQRKLRVVIDFVFEPVHDRSTFPSVSQQDHRWNIPVDGQSILNKARFWLSLGVDGLRLRGFKSRKTVQKLRTVIDDEYPDRILLGEMQPNSSSQKSNGLFHLIYNTSFLSSPFMTPEWIHSNQSQYLNHVPDGSWQAVGFEDYSNSQPKHHFYSGENALEISRLWAALILTMRVTPFLCYGEEIGINPWLPVNPNSFHEIIVGDQVKNPISLFNFYRRLIHLRRSSPALSNGDYQSIFCDHNCLAYLRCSQEQVYLICINFSASLHSFDLHLEESNAEVIFSNWGREGEHGKQNRLSLAPYEIYIAEVF